MVEAPRLSAMTEKLKYRTDVRMWMQRVIVFASGGDTKAKSISNGFVHALYAGMDSSYQKVIEAEIQLRGLKLGPESDEEVFTFRQHKDLVEMMLRIVAKDSPTDAAKRFINPGRKVFGCKRGKGESYSVFVERFRGIA